MPLPNTPFSGSQSPSPVPVYITLSELIAGPVRPHIPPPAGPQLPTLLLLKSYT